MAAKVTYEAAPTETAPMETTGKPIRCLVAVGLIDVGRQQADLWRGLQDRRSYSIVIRRLAKPAKAPTVVAGTYAVAGSFRVVAEGEGLSEADGLEADARVQEVADCLGG